MINRHEIFGIHTPARAYFEDITPQIAALVEKSGLESGIVTVFSQHTSCSVLIQEESEDVTYWGTQLILQDMLNVFETLIPTCRNEGQYLHPGPIHIKNAVEQRQELPAWGLNTDGHLRSVLLGRSETIPVVEGAMTLGEFGRIYFADLDQVRQRDRTVRVHLLGEPRGQ